MRKFLKKGYQKAAENSGKGTIQCFFFISKNFIQLEENREKKTFLLEKSKKKKIFFFGIFPNKISERVKSQNLKTERFLQVNRGKNTGTMHA